MKKFVLTTLAGLFSAGALMVATTDADARGFHRGGGRVGVYIGAPFVVSPWYSPYYGYGYAPYPYGYYPPVVREEPTVFIEQQPAAAPAPAAPAPQAQAQGQPQYWYYCQESQSYYPYVQTCVSPWQRVMPHAPQ